MDQQSAGSAPAVPCNPVEDAFNTASSAPTTSALWTGMNPAQAKEKFGVTDIPNVDKKQLNADGTEILILGYKPKVDAKGKTFYVYLILPRQEKPALAFVSLESLPFLDSVKKSKLPVKGKIVKVLPTPEELAKKEPKRPYWIFRS
jgi:hypothetical protein